MHANSYRFSRRMPAALFALAVAAGFSGCMHRRMTVQTDPPGARVLVDGQDIGLTPASLDFNYYATRQITLIKDGYETRTIMQRVETPWYEVPPLDFFSDNFVPFKVTNRHEFRYSLQRQQQVPQHDLIDRANSTRKDLQVGQ
jgi:PEGA domain